MADLRATTAILGGLEVRLYGCVVESRGRDIVVDMSRMLVVSIIFAGCLGCGLDTRGVGPARCDWERMAVAAPAPARYYHSLTRAQDDALWLFGGTPGDDKEPFGSLYRLGDGVWIAGPDGPPPREKHAAAYHRQSAQLLVFGGLGFDLLDDTWTFDGAKWVDVSSPGPSPRKQAAAAYHPDSEMVVLFGGQGAGDVFLSDTWLWDGKSWHEARRCPCRCPSAPGRSLRWPR